jgi:hypothetical protein
MGREVETKTVMTVMCLILVIFFISITFIILLGFFCLFGAAPGARRDWYYFPFGGTYPPAGLSHTVLTTVSDSRCSVEVSRVSSTDQCEEKDDEEQYQQEEENATKSASRNMRNH